jgi:hypothetical protein
MAKLIGFDNITTDSKNMKQGQVLVKNPKWKEGSKEPKYILEQGTYVYDGKLWQVGQLKMNDGSFMIPKFEETR